MNAIDPHIAQRAVQWMLELQSPPVSAATLQGWQAWRAQDARHEQAWQRIERFSERFAGLSHNPDIAHATLTAAEPQRRRALKALTVLVAGGVLWSARDSRLWQDWRADYYSGIGEQRRITLADGTRVLLNTDSAIAVNFTAGIREVRLVRGEVQIDTGHDARPFWVLTRVGRARPLGTRFNVRDGDGYCRVAVSSGAVALYPGQASQPASVLQAGEQATLTAEQAGPGRTISALEQAWTDGIIIASEQRLEDFVRELSRYRPGHLGCAAAVADVRVSGTFPLASSERILQTLAATLNLRVRQFTPWWVTLEGNPVQG